MSEKLKSVWIEISCIVVCLILLLLVKSNAGFNMVNASLGFQMGQVTCIMQDKTPGLCKSQVLQNGTCVCEKQ